ncbi:TerD family protein [Lachnospiraceae bacterium ZAX-1]
METMQRGFRSKLDSYIDVTSDFDVELSLSGQSEYDYCCFGIDAADKLSDDRYMVFYNQMNTPNNEIVLLQNQNPACYKINVNRLPSTISRLVFTASIDGHGTMSMINSCSLLLKQNGNTALRLNLTGSDFQQEKAIIVIENLTFGFMEQLQGECLLLQWTTIKVPYQQTIGSSCVRSVAQTMSQTSWEK